MDTIKNRHSQLATEYGFYVPLVLKVAPIRTVTSRLYL